MAGVPFHAVEQYLAQAGEARRVGRDLRADRRPGDLQGAGRAQGHAHRDARHADRRGAARDRRATTLARRAVQRRGTRSGSPGCRSRAGGFASSRSPRARSPPSSTACSPPRCSFPTTWADTLGPALRQAGAVAQLARLAVRPRRAARALREQFGDHDLAGYGCDDCTRRRPPRARCSQYCAHTQAARCRT